MSEATLAFGLVVVFALIHLFVGNLRALDGAPRSAWLSAAGGAAVAYVFLHLLPELAIHQSIMAQEAGLSLIAVELSVYALALLGLTGFYMLEAHVRKMRAPEDTLPADEVQLSKISKTMWLLAATFAVYNIVISYLLLHREGGGTGSLVIFGIAMALHFVTTDHALRQEHPGFYQAAIRWMLAAAAILGWVIGLFVALPKILIGCLFSLLAGGIVLNVLKEELPAEREARVLPFLLGVLIYGGLLIVEVAIR